MVEKIRSFSHQVSQRRLVSRAEQGSRLIPFGKLAKARKFDEIRSILREDDDTVKAWLCQGCGESGSSSSDTGSADLTKDTVEEFSSPFHCERDQTTPLHLIVKYLPSVDVVDKLCTKMQELNKFSIPEDYADGNGMSPLHIAVARGCDIEVVRRLMQGQVMDLPATTMDANGRTPLHWACTKTRGAGFFATKKGIENSIKNVYILIRAYPHAKVIKDENNMTPLDLALKHRADQRIIEALYPTRRQVKRSLSGIFTCSVASGTGNCCFDMPDEIEWDKGNDDVSSVGSRSRKGPSDNPFHLDFDNLGAFKPVPAVSDDSIKDSEQRMLL